MANTTNGLKNVNLLNKTQYAAQPDPATDELWAVDIDSDADKKEKIIGWGMPKYNATVNIGSGYIAPSNGFLKVRAYNNGGTAYGYIDGIEVFNWIDDGNSRGTSFIKISKGSVWTINGNFEIQQFIPCVGG